MKRFLLRVSIFLLCATLCVGKGAKIPSETEYEAFPALFCGWADRMNDKNHKASIHIVVRNRNDLLNVTYFFLIGSGSGFANGAIHYTKKGLVLDYPTDVDFSKCDGSDAEKQALIDFYFPDKKRCFLEYQPEMRLLNSKGFFTYKDVVLDHSIITRPLSSGDSSFYDGVPVVLLNKRYTVNDVANIYEKPDFKSPVIPVTNVPWRQFKPKDKKITVLDKDYKILAWRGFVFQAKAMSLKKVSRKGTSDVWYLVDTNNYCKQKYGWIYGGDLLFLERFADAGQLYGSEVMDRATKSKILSMEDFEVPSNLKYFCIGEEGESELYYNSDDIYLFCADYAAKLDREKLFVDSDGFLKLDMETEKLLLIDGERISQCFRNFQTDGENKYEDEESEYANEYIKSVSASSFLSEKINGRTINYSADNLYKCFFSGCRCHPYWWNDSHIPWVEGVKGNGIGEYVTVEFTQEVVGMSILNGYTDINNMKLYKENSRVKTLRIDDLEHNVSQKMTFEDMVYFNYIQFKKPTSKIKITIEEVYPGSKYNDTCISAIIPSSRGIDWDEISERIRSKFMYKYSFCQEVPVSEIVEYF